MTDWNDPTAHIERHRALREHIALRTPAQQRVRKIAEPLMSVRSWALLFLAGFVGGVTGAFVLQSTAGVAKEVSALVSAEMRRKTDARSVQRTEGQKTERALRDLMKP